MIVWVATDEPDHANSTIVGVALTPESAMAIADKVAGQALDWQPYLSGFTAMTYTWSLGGFDVFPFEVTE